MAASAGDRVSALNSEMAIANAMVSENCLYRIPVVPGKNDTGTNTEISTSDVAMTALDTSAMATEVAVCGSVRSSLMCRCTFSMTTIASSTTSPVARVMPNKRQRIDGEAEDLDEGKGADQRDRNGDGRNDRGAPVQQEQEDYDDDDQNGFFQRGHHFADRVADHGRRIEGDDVLDSRRKGLRQFRQLRPCAALSTWSALAFDSCCTPTADGFVPAVEKVGVVALGANFSPPNILQLHDAVLRVLEDDASRIPLDRRAVRPRAA